MGVEKNYKSGKTRRQPGGAGLKSRAGVPRPEELEAPRLGVRLGLRSVNHARKGCGRDAEQVGGGRNLGEAGRGGVGGRGWVEREGWEGKAGWPGRGTWGRVGATLGWGQEEAEKEGQLQEAHYLLQGVIFPFTPPYHGFEAWIVVKISRGKGKAAKHYPFFHARSRLP